MLSNCLSCDEEINYNPKRSKGKYCNNKCQKIYERELYITQWLAGENNGTQVGKTKHLSSHIKTFLREESTECNICGITEWNKKPIVLDIDHIDGDSLNNIRTNLRLLCPNCHSQTDTFKGRNRGNSSRTYGRKLPP